MTDACSFPGECGRPIGHRGQHGGWRSTEPRQRDLGAGVATGTRRLVESLRRRGWTVTPPKGEVGS